MERFEPGQVIVHRNTRRNRIAFARPVRVVADDEHGLLTWLCRDTPAAYEVDVHGRGARGLPFAEWAAVGAYRMKLGSWHGPGILQFYPPDADHSVWWFWNPDGTFKNWYVNLEDRSIRWYDDGLAGVDVVDQDLDVEVFPDLSWNWKDEDEFAERLAVPDHYWVADEAAVRAEGRRVIKQAEAGEFPFDGTWTDFVPDPGWGVPSLPPGWDRPATR